MRPTPPRAQRLPVKVQQVLPRSVLPHRDPWAALDIHQVGVASHGGNEVLSDAARAGVGAHSLHGNGSKKAPNGSIPTFQLR